ncbi:hypothetical protein D3C75_1298320 [compost metagenome]
MRVLPAQCGLQADDPAVAHVDPGLVMHAQFAGHQRLAYPLDRLMRGLDLAVADHVE